jgi:predicted nucleotidyltransferase
MIRNLPLPENIDELMPEAFGYLQSDDDILFAYLFGSLVKRKAEPLSDVDIAVYCRETLSFADKKLEILGKLMDILKTDEIDLVLLNRAPLTLRMKILEHKKIIVDRLPFLRHQYESLTMRQYFDFSFKESSILKKRFLHGRQDAYPQETGRT